MNLIFATTRSVLSGGAAKVILAFISLSVVFMSIANALNKGLDQDLALDALVPLAILTTLIIIVGACRFGANAASQGSIGFAYLANNHRFKELFVRVGVITVALNAAAWLGVGLSYLALTAMGVTVDLNSWGNGQEGGAVLRAVLLEWIVYAVLASLTAILIKSSAFSMLIWMLELFILEPFLPVLSNDWVQQIIGGLPGVAVRKMMHAPVLATGWSAPASCAMLVAWFVILGGVTAYQVKRRPVQ